MAVLPVSRERCKKNGEGCALAVLYRLLPSSTALYRPLPPVAALALRIHAHLVPLLVLVLELDLPVDDREQRVVGPTTDVQAGMKFRAPLLHQDAPRAHELSPERFHAEVLGARVAAVAGGTDALLMSHSLPHSPFSFTSAMRTSVNGWRWPAWRR